MAYTTDAKIRAISGVTTAEVSTTNMTAIIANVDIEIDRIVKSAYYYAEFFENQGDERVIIMNSATTVSDFVRVEVNGEEILEEDKKELMDNGEVEEVDSGATGGVEDWESASDTSATYTHADTPYHGRKSLQITAGAQETAYWETTDNIEVEYPQDQRIPAYRLTYYVKTTSITAGGGNGVYANILWYNGSDTLLATDSDSANAVTGTADFAKLTVTKYAPDTASHIKVRCINDAASGDAYFDSMKFRKLNWVTKTTDASIDLLRSYTDSFIAIWFSKTDTVNPIVENLATDLCSRAALVHASGGTIQGLSYKLDVFQVNKGRQSKERGAMINRLTQSVADWITRLRGDGLLKDIKQDWVIGLNTLE